MLRAVVDYGSLNTHIANRIRELRQKKGLTVQELAYRSDMERSNLSRIELGGVNITLKTMCKICNALEVTLTDLLKD